MEANIGKDREDKDRKGGVAAAGSCGPVCSLLLWWERKEGRRGQWVWLEPKIKVP